MPGLIQTFVATSFSWFVASSLWVYPHSLSYFNESIGGPLNGPKHLLGSNVDWGQDLRYLISWDRLTERGQLYVAYFGSFSSEVVAPEMGKSPNAELDPHLASKSHPQFYAISLNLLRGMPWPANFGGRSGVYSEDLIQSLSSEKIAARVGYSIAVFEEPARRLSVPKEAIR
jgi:hypothetical protein